MKLLSFFVLTIFLFYPLSPVLWAFTQNTEDLKSSPLFEWILNPTVQPTFCCNLDRMQQKPGITVSLEVRHAPCMFEENKQARHSIEDC